jgi:hypothetical protein
MLPSSATEVLFGNYREYFSICVEFHCLEAKLSIIGWYFYLLPGTLQLATASIHCITNTCLESQPFEKLYGTHTKQYGNVCGMRFWHRKARRTGYVQQTNFMTEPISLLPRCCWR